MQSLVGKIEQLTTNSRPDQSLKTLKEKIDQVNTVKPYYELMPNQSAVIFSEFEEGIEISLAVGMADEDEEVLPAGALTAMALFQRISKDPEFLEKVMELFEPDSEE